MHNDHYHHGNLKAELIQKGLKILDEEGYEGFSLRKVAKACNVTQTSAYRHFANKDDLVKAIALEIVKQFDECLKKAEEKYQGDPEKQLREIGYAYIEFFVKNPQYLRLLFLSDIFQKLLGEMHPHAVTEFPQNTTPETMSEIHASSFQTFYSAVIRYKNADTTQKYAQLCVEDLMLYLWGLVHGMAVLLSKNEFIFPDDPMEHVRKLIFFEGIL